MEVTKIILSKISRFCQLLSHKRAFLSNLETFGLTCLLCIILNPACFNISLSGEISSWLKGMYNNMVKLATNMLSKDVFDKATFIKVNI